MKKVFFTLIAALAFTASSFAQTTVSTVSETEFRDLQNENIYIFVLPANITSDDVALMADEFEGRMEAEFNAQTSTCKLILDAGHITYREHVQRFLVGLGMEEVRMDGNTLSLKDFSDTYVLNR